MSGGGEQTAKEGKGQGFTEVLGERMAKGPPSHLSQHPSSPGALPFHLGLKCWYLCLCFFPKSGGGKLILYLSETSRCKAQVIWKYCQLVLLPLSLLFLLSTHFTCPLVSSDSVSGEGGLEREEFGWGTARDILDKFIHSFY